MLYILTSKCMLAHAFAWLKTIKIIRKSPKSTFFIMRMIDSCKTHEEKYSKWGARFWVLTSFWESLPIADQQTFFFIFLHEPYMSLSCAWWKKVLIHDFLMFFIVFDHANAWVLWSKYTTQNTWWNLEIVEVLVVDDLKWFSWQMRVSCKNTIHYC